MTMLFCNVLVALLMFNTNGEETVTGPVFPGKDPGKARAEISDSSLILANEAIEARWNLRDGRLRFDSIVNRLDTHWIGGDPGDLDVYGWAAWSPRKGTITLRNPDEKKRPFPLDVIKAFELPVGASPRYTLTSPFKDQRLRDVEAVAGKACTLALEPFEVLVFDAIPYDRSK